MALLCVFFDMQMVYAVYLKNTLCQNRPYKMTKLFKYGAW